MAEHNPSRFHIDNRSALSEAETDEMWVHVLRSPRLFAAAVEALDAGELSNAFDDRAMLVIAACRELRDAGLAPGDAPFFARLRAQIAAAAENTRDIDLGEAIIEQAEELLVGGVIDQAETVGADQLDEAYGASLLRRFALLHTVVGPLRLALPRSNAAEPTNIEQVFEELNRRMRALQQLGGRPTYPMGEEWDGHEQRLAGFRGRSIIGLRTGMVGLDRQTMGVRGLGILAAPPGKGKTNFVLQVAIGVCQHHTENDAVVVFLSLEMDKDTVYSRVKCNMGQIDYQRLMLGSPEGEREEGFYFSAADQEKLNSARALADDGQVMDRLVVVDSEALGSRVTAEGITFLIAEAKARVGATKALLVVDYFQLLPVPAEVADRGDIEADRHRINLLKEVIERSRTEANPQGDAILAISEARKPADEKQGWGRSLSELMGTSRLGYAPTLVMLYQVMNDAEVMAQYQCSTKAEAQQHRRLLESDGISPVLLTIVKGRDGMSWGSWPLEFHFRQSRFTEPTDRADPPCQPPPRRGPRAPASRPVPAEDDNSLDDLPPPPPSPRRVARGGRS